MNKLITLCKALVMVLLLQSCNGTETFTDNEIDPKLQELISRKNDSLLAAMSNSDLQSFKALGSPDFVKFLRSRIESSVWAFRKGVLNTEYKIYKQYYNKHSNTNSYAKLESEDGDYTFTFKNNTKETYVALLKTSYMGIGDYLVTVIYELHDNQWKVDHVNVGVLGQFGKNASEYFELAKQKEKEGYLIDALFYSDIAMSCLEPAGKMMVYENIDKMQYYQKEWQNRVSSQYKFPQVVSGVRSNPQIVDLKPVVNTEGMFPMFSYVTPVPLADKKILTMEFEDIKREVRNLYPALDFNAKYIYYRAYNSPSPGADYHEFKETQN
ncbi:hypothetical protein KJK34_07390 [Flavobacterium sp. D11R37]|uniref:hypothetical protein n=1 Tax=Flavobacterium coralii TaxID=2838017 RepID=UPI001CA714DB|nr:hypothetical protein [Flavobacterium coralii]MBY8962572.1 hypothetical protein [Flavobacterium coralii]